MEPGPLRNFAVSALLAAAALARNPAPPAFEVASVKINRQAPFVDRELAAKGDTLTMRNLTLRVIAASAYNLPWSQIAGPSWIDSDRFDIVAKGGKPLTEDAMRARAMAEPRPTSEAELRLSFLQDLLAGELGLKLEPRRAPVEFLVIDRADQKPTEN